MIVKLLVEGGKMQPGPALSQKLGPMGINMGEVLTKVNEATANFKGLKVPVELDVNSTTKEFSVKVFSPPVSELLKKELGIAKASGTQHKQYVGNLSIEQIISVAKTKFPNLLCNDLKTAVKTIIGTCASLGILVENQRATEWGHQIAGGKFAKEIAEERTETPEDKKKKLAEYFETIQKEQELVIKQETAAKEAAESAKKEVPGEAKVEEKKVEPAKKK